jgi:hypothetical protein
MIEDTDIAGFTKKPPEPRVYGEVCDVERRREILRTSSVKETVRRLGEPPRKNSPLGVRLLGAIYLLIKRSW